MIDIQRVNPVCFCPKNYTKTTPKLHGKHKFRGKAAPGISEKTISSEATDWYKDDG